MNLLVIFTALAFGGAVYFIHAWLTARASLKNMTRIEQTTAEIEESRREFEKKPLKDQLRSYAKKHGFEGNLTLPVLAILGLYCAILVLLTLLSVPPLISILGAVPVSIGAVYFAMLQAAVRRRKAFNRQLVQGLTLLAAQLEMGNGPLAALEAVVPSVPDPLAEELAIVLNTSGVSTDVITALTQLNEKYPSRALALTIAAFEVDRDHGGKLAPTIRQAAEILRRDRELNEETLAEISQARMEFYSLVTIVSGITGFMIITNSRTSPNPYFTLFGIIGLCVGAVLFATGLFWGKRVFNKAGGEA